MLSVVGITEAASNEYNSLQKGNLRAVTFKLDPNSKTRIDIDVDQTLPSDASHAEILELFPKDDCRFAFFNLDYMEGAGRRTKTFFVLWVPGEAKTKNKMVYASSAVPFKSKFGVMCPSVQTGSVDAIEYDTLVEHCRKTYA